MMPNLPNKKHSVLSLANYSREPSARKPCSSARLEFTQIRGYWSPVVSIRRYASVGVLFLYNALNNVRGPSPAPVNANELPI